MDFIRPAMSSSIYDVEDSQEWDIVEEFDESQGDLSPWGMYDDSDDEPVSPCPDDGLISHPFWCECAVEAECATAHEARLFWMDGGWDDQVHE